MLKRFFITGTDTAVGKTVVSRALLQALAASGRSVAGYKPVAHSCPINYGLLSKGLAHLTERVDHVVVEGTGGWRGLMNDLRPLSDWVVQEQLPVIMVVGIQEGCINHALLTAQAIASDGLPLIGWVANRINPGLAHYAEIINVLGKKIPAPMIGELPYLPRAEQRELAHYIDVTLLTRTLIADRVLA